MVDVLTEITIACPINVVAEYVSNPENATDWYVNIMLAKKQKDEPIELGSLIDFEAHFMGRKLIYTYEIMELVPNQKMVMSTQQGPFPMTTTYTWESIASDQTKMTLRNSGQPSGFSKIMAPFMSKMMKKANNKDLQLLKKILESKFPLLGGD
ncbi:MAG: SRPBCC family protein [Cyclobacteriaceae bacterium]